MFRVSVFRVSVFRRSGVPAFRRSGVPAFRVSVQAVGSRSEEGVFEDHGGQIVARSQMNKDGNSDN